MPYYLSSCNHTIGMKCIDIKALKSDGESDYIYIECPFCKKKQESNLKIQTTLTKILKDVHFQSVSQNG